MLQKQTEMSLQVLKCKMIPGRYLVINLFFVPLLQNRTDISETDHIGSQINGILKIIVERIGY